MRIVAFFFVFLFSSAASAQEVHLSLGASVGWLIAGSSELRGRPESPTGGVAMILSGTAAVQATPWLDVYYTQSPMVVAPQSLESLGIVDANDLGFTFHTTDRVLGLSVAGTAAPSWMNFCNGAAPEPWCLKEVLFIWGGEVHFDVRLSSQREERAMILRAGGRLMYAQPEAWTYERLTPDERRIIPTIVMFDIGGRWSM
jgi:hypothetical protein